MTAEPWVYSHTAIISVLSTGVGSPGGPVMTAQPLGLTSEHRVSLLSANSSSDQHGRCAHQAQLNSIY